MRGKKELETERKRYIFIGRCGLVYVSCVGSSSSSSSRSNRRFFLKDNGIGFRGIYCSTRTNREEEKFAVKMLEYFLGPGDFVSFFSKLK